MSLAAGAILAGWVLAAAVSPPEEVFVRFQLTDGVQVTGTMTTWDAEGFDGTFGRRLWVELVPRDTWRLYVNAMDQNDPHQWVELGRALLLSEGGEEWAERAFRRGLTLDESVARAIDAAREARRAADARRREQREAIERQRLATVTPEAAGWDARPWPPHTPDDRVAALEELRGDAARILRQAGIQLVPLETDHYVIHADLVPIDTARLATRLEAACAELTELLWLSEHENLFWGKAVVFYFADADRFRLVEAESFEQLVSRSVIGITHYDGPKVFINLTGPVAGDAFHPAAVREAVHAFLHRYRSPRRLPPWATEGLAEHVAERVAGNELTARRRAAALAFVRGGGDVAALLASPYPAPAEPEGDPEATAGGVSWPGPEGVGPAVGALLVELMLGQRPDGFGAWVRAVKRGADWREALADEYGVPLPALVETFTRYYRVND